MAASVDTAKAASSSSWSSFLRVPAGEQEWLHDEETMEQASDQDRFLDLEELQFLTTEGIDKHGRRIVRVVGKFFPAPVIENLHLKDYVLFKISKEVSNEPFCIVYFHTRVNKSENCPGLFNLRWIYETLPQDFRQRLEAIYFVHPGILSKTIMGTFGRFLSYRLYDKVKYISRLEFMWDEVRKGQVEVPYFVFEHDKVLEERPLMDYWIESDPFSTLSSSGLEHRRHSRWMP